MRKKLDKQSVGRRLVRLAERQHGVITRRQLLDLGLSDAAVCRRVKDGRLHRVHRGVYAVGRPTLTVHGRFFAAVASCGPTAALSHASAAALWGLLPEPRGARVDITVSSGGGRRRRGAVIVHRAPLREEEVVVKGGIKVTTPARTIVDLADGRSERQIERVLDEAAYLRLDLSELAVRAGRRGAGRLRRVLTRHQPGATWTRSEREERMLLLLQRCRLPRPELNRGIEGHEVDFVWRANRLIVETDGWRAHGTRRAFERDRRRDVELTAAGWRVLRVSHAALEHDPDWVARKLRGALR
jgi:very-short-patch-repair endonuclease/predicted transcriptional regulator of viral defense system